MIADLSQDLRFGARMLMKKPAFTPIAGIALALGIGANAAIFSVVNAVLLRPLPFHDPERLVRVWRSSGENDRSQVSFPDFADFRAQQSVFEKMAAWRNVDCTLTGIGDPVNLRGVIVTADLSRSALAQLGRGFIPEEDQADHHAVILSHSLWRERFNSGPEPGWDYDYPQQPKLPRRRSDARRIYVPDSERSTWICG
jgi:putative ABC transport system permease protein